MALNNDAIFTAAKGHVYTAPIPASPAALVVRPTPAEIAAFDPAVGLGAGWNELGHTDREDLPEFGFEGGDTETRGTWQNAVMREVITEAATDYLILTLNQFDEEALSLYYGVENSADALAGEYVVDDVATATVERSMAMVVIDGDYKIGFYAPKVSIRRDDSMEMAIDEFTKMPLRMSFLKQEPRGASTYPLFVWINGEINAVAS